MQYGPLGRRDGVLRDDTILRTKPAACRLTEQEPTERNIKDEVKGRIYHT